MADGDFANFRAVYDELTDEVNRAKYQFLPDHIANWFRTLDTTPRVAAIIKRLESGVDYREWRHKLTRGVGQTRIEWPTDPEQALGIKLTLFRNFTVGGPDDIGTFGFSFLRVGRNINDNAHAVVEQIFMPMARELRRYLERELSEVPAADRVVKLDHNSAPYQELLDRLAQLEEALRASNEYQNVVEKEQRIAEVSASHRLLQATQVRVQALATLLGPVVTQFTTKVKDNLITAAALAVSAAIIALLGHIL